MTRGFPKKCGHTPDRRVIAPKTWQIAVAVEKRANPDFLVIAHRACTSLGLAEAIRRGRFYAGARAHLLFVEPPETEAEMEEIGPALGDKP